MVAATPPQKSRVDPKIVNRAVKALLKWRDSKSKTQEPRLLEHGDFVYLIVTLKKIAQKHQTSPEKIPLPYPPIDIADDSPELCLIIDDRSKNRITKEAAMKKIESDNIPISRVIKISKFKTDYGSLEAKKKLCDSYEILFAERRLVPLLPRLLGKQFFKKKKIPVAVDLKQKNWKEQIEKACGSALFFMGTGTCSVVKVAKLSMGSREIAENVMAAIIGIADFVPSKWKNIRSFHLKLLESLALPVYQSGTDMNLKLEASTNTYDVEEGNGEAELEVSDYESKNVSGSMMKKKKKERRINKDRFMDPDISGLDLLDVGGDDEDNEIHGMFSRRKKNKPVKKMAMVKK